MNYFLPAALRDAWLEWCETREKKLSYMVEPEIQEFAAQLRDLKPLREVHPPGMVAEYHTHKGGGHS